MMNKYNLLGHIFELEPRAYEFLASYVTRIEQYAKHHKISKDILEDIQYNIIEKLYQSETPIHEAFVMNLAQTIGEPEEIFEQKGEGEQPTDETKSSFLVRYFGKQKPMLWGVCYWIAKSFRLPVEWVRLLFLLSLFFYGTALWLYPLLALFVPYRDKKQSSGNVGNAFFELVRVLIWLVIFLVLGAGVVGMLFGIAAFSWFPLLSNQAIQTLFPPFYPLAVIALIALLLLWIGSLGALLKKPWLSKTWAMICIIIFVLSGVATGISGYHEFAKYNYNTPTNETHVLGTWTTTEPTLLINLQGDTTMPAYNYLPLFFEEDFQRAGLFQEIELLPAEGNEVRVELHDRFNIPRDKAKDQILAKRTEVTVQLSGNTMTLALPDMIFSEKVPFVFAERVIKLYVPVDKQIRYNNQSSVRYKTPRRRYDRNATNQETIVTCNDTSSFIFYERFGERRCAQTTASAVNRDDDDADDRHDRDDRVEDYFDQWDDDRRERPSNASNSPLQNDPASGNPSDLDYLQSMYLGMSLEQAENYSAEHDRLFRVVTQDGQELPRTEDYRPGRINAEVEDGVVVGIEVE